MNLKRFECFVAVAEELHFGRAAARMHLSQPPLSLQIRALEEELGVRLFERTSKIVYLTQAGEALLPEARAILASADRAALAARQAGHGEAGSLRIGFINPAMDGFLSRAVRSFRLERPGVELILKEMQSSEQLAAIKARALHAGFIRHGWLDVGHLETTVVLRESYVLALPEGHVFADLNSLPLRALADLPLIMYPRSTLPCLFDAMISALQKAGVTPNIVQEAVSKHTMLSLVAAGLGGALVPESTMVWQRQQVRFLRIEGELPVVEIAVVHPKEGHPALRRLVELIGGPGSQKKPI